MASADELDARDRSQRKVSLASDSSADRQQSKVGVVADCRHLDAARLGDLTDSDVGIAHWSVRPAKRCTTGTPSGLVEVTVISVSPVRSVNSMSRNEQHCNSRSARSVASSTNVAGRRNLTPSASYSMDVATRCRSDHSASRSPAWPDERVHTTGSEREVMTQPYDLKFT